jgi:branched-subunit amino acid aminotransferase/4-amino-4-deoxychorismate lyase
MLRIEKIFPGEQLAIDPRESAFSHGMGIFESIQISNGYLQFWDRHWARLKASASHLFSYELSEANESDSLEAIRTYFQAIGQRNLILKLSFMVLANESVLYIYSRERISDDGPAKLCLNKAHPINENGVYAGYKTHNYFENMLLLKEAKLAGFTDYLRVNTQGEVCETCVGNCFFIKGGEMITASRQTGLFPGIIRAVLLEALPIKEKPIRVEDLQAMDGCFVTNSIVEIVPVSEIAGLPTQTILSFSESTFSEIETIASTLKTIAQSEVINLH